ncbi:MAG TPA: sulfurase [Rhodobacteraceae bacterium]|nr:sulfurase [Paracoccaceae bacterium]
MPALAPTSYSATVTWLGHVPDRAARLASDPLEAVDLTFAGIAGESRGGEIRPSCSRVLALHPRDTPIRNTRQISILSEEDLAAMAAEMGVDRVAPAWLGAGMALRGIPDFSHVPPSSRLQAPGGATLVIDMENRPCHLPVPVIEAERPGHGAAFRRAARGRRGVTAWVEREGRIALGDSLRLFVPDQPAWAP